LTTTAPDGWVRFEPDLLSTGLNIDLLKDVAHFEAEPQSDGSLLVATRERAIGSAAPGLQVTLLARGSAFEPSGLEALAGATPITASTDAGELAALREVRRSWLADVSEAEPLWARFTGEVQLAEDEALADLLVSVQEAGNESDSLWLVSSDPVLSFRFALMRGLLAARHTSEAWTVASAGFPAARFMMTNSTSTFPLYLLPSIIFRAPYVTGWAAMRPYATLVRLQSDSEPGRPVTWGSPLDSYSGGMYRRAGMPPSPWPTSESLADREFFLNWWTDRISRLLRLAGDPACFVDDAGNYSPNKHFGAILTLERLMVTAVEIIRLRRHGEFLRTLLLFDFLDLLEGHGMGTYEQNLHLTKQAALWNDLVPSLPNEVKRCVRPLVDGGFEALLKVDDGLWASSRRRGAFVVVDKKSGAGSEDIGIDRARGEYLRILRDAHHGYRKIVNNPRDLSYLTMFDASLSERLPDLVWWYLMRLLEDPEPFMR
jgi:hypothetical protein